MSETGGALIKNSKSRQIFLQMLTMKVFVDN